MDGEHITPEEYRALKVAPKANKYRAKQVVVDGLRFHSTGEAKRWGELKLMERAGEISDLRRQVSFPLACNDRAIQTRGGKQMQYFADFTYTANATRQKVIEDFKGKDTPESYLKRQIVEAMTGITIKITGRRR